jgi:hypothetical protein
MRAAPLLLLLLLAGACRGESATGPAVPLNAEFVLAPGELARIADTGVQLRFDGVAGDSRCPADAFCILGGDAIVRVVAVDARALRLYELHTGDMRPVSHRDLTIALVQLSPYPFSSQAIQPGDYRATLRVTR